MVITYKVNAKPEAHQLAELFAKSGIKRPVDDLNRIKTMIDNSNLMVTAWDGEKLVGSARAITDFGFYCYIADLAIDKEYQNHGIGHELVNEVIKQAGDECTMVVISPPETMEYFPKIGFERCGDAFIIPRKK
ncbi:MAG TPA: GNAT family N-acetyltransferase [Ignavibacteria bacterium]|jgi:ribosomal protein S18 acetylase RimI-like enzyme